MPNASTLTVTTPTDREIVMTRAFDAPRALVWEAITVPELLKRWLFGPDGWSLDVCQMDLRSGGKYRYEWWHAARKTRMGMGGVFREVAAPERLVATERFDDAWYPGEALVTQVLAEKDGKTLLTMTLRYESREGRDIALRSGMETGMEQGYARVDEMLASLGSRAAAPASAKTTKRS